MVHKASAIMIIALAGILLLAVLAAIPSNNYAFASSQSESIPPPVYPHYSNSTGNVQESNSTGNGLFS
jgi:hypothetical protein